MISSIGNNSSAQKLLSTQAPQNDNDADDVNGAQPSARTGLSAMAQDLSKLQQLQKDDPEKFKSVMAQIAQSLSTQQPATPELTRLSDQFQQASQSGEMPSIGRAHHGGHGHHHADGPQGAAAQTYSKADARSAWQTAESAISSALSGAGL